MSATTTRARRSPQEPRTAPDTTTGPSGAPGLPGSAEDPRETIDDDELARIIVAHSKTVVIDERSDGGLRAQLRRLVAEVAGPLVASAAYTAEGGGEVWEPWRTIDAAVDDRIWTDLRPSEAMRLMDLVRVAIDRAVPAAERIIVEAIVGAALQFDDENPDVLRDESLKVPA